MNNYGIFFSAGLGDALMMIPLIKRLKETGSVTGIFTSSFNTEELFGNCTLIDQCLNLNSIPEDLKFNSVYLNSFAVNKENLVQAYKLSNDIRIVSTNHKWLKIIPGIKLIKPVNGIHDVAQNLRMWNSGFLNSEFDISEMNYPLISDAYSETVLKKYKLPEVFRVIQFSSGNFAAPYKNWPAKYWSWFLRKYFEADEIVHLVIIGDSNETEWVNSIVESNQNVYNLCGKTTIPELMAVISHSSMFIGLDGGPMHLSVALNNPTFTIWGGSDPALYGYEQFDAKNHRCLVLKPDCHPCNSWISPNTKKTTSPENCPDFDCLNLLKPELVFDEFQKFVTKLNLSYVS